MRSVTIRNDIGGMKFTLALSVFVLVGLCSSSAWADGYSNYNRVYNGQVSQSATYPQYFPRIEPESSTYYNNTPYQQPQYTAPQQTADPASRPLSAKISDGFRDLWRSPSVKSGIAGAGIGLGAAALTEKALWRGTLIGAGYGVGVGLMDESYYFKRHPFIRRSAKGAAIGLGAAVVTGAAALGPAAAVGAGVGAGIHYLKTH